MVTSLVVRAVDDPPERGPLSCGEFQARLYADGEFDRFAYTAAGRDCDPGWP